MVLSFGEFCECCITAPCDFIQLYVKYVTMYYFLSMLLAAAPLTGGGGVAGAADVPRGGQPHAGPGGGGTRRSPRPHRAAAQVARQRQEATAHGRERRL